MMTAKRDIGTGQAGHFEGKAGRGTPRARDKENVPMSRYIGTGQTGHLEVSPGHPGSGLRPSPAIPLTEGEGA